jgi:hypothetical protein
MAFWTFYTCSGVYSFCLISEKFSSADVADLDFNWRLNCRHRSPQEQRGVSPSNRNKTDDDASVLWLSFPRDDEENDNDKYR